MSHDPHFGFFVAAFVLALAVIGGMIAAVAFEYRRLRRALAVVEALGPQQCPPDKSSPQSGDPQEACGEGLE